MADKADTLAGCFGLGKVPTGASDPYALRRAALGIIRIIREHNLNIQLNDLLTQALAGYAGVDLKVAPAEAQETLNDFFAQRLKADYVAKGLPTPVVDAALGAGFGDLVGLDARMAALLEFSRSDGFDQAVLTFKRAANIIRKQADMDLSGVYSAEHFETDHERDLAQAVETAAPRFDELWQAGDYPALFGLLAELRPAVDGFFDNVMVMCDDEAVKVNRLNLLKALTAMLGRLADFDALQV
jgi:glycyl-tRNA synthetase beta chain